MAARPIPSNETRAAGTNRDALYVSSKNFELVSSNGFYHEDRARRNYRRG